MLADNQVHDAQLSEMITPRRLEHWFGLAQEEAKKMVEEENEAVRLEDEAAKALSRKLVAEEDKARFTVGNGESLVDVDGKEGLDQVNEARDAEVVDVDDEEEGSSLVDGDGDGDVEMS